MNRLDKGIYDKQSEMAGEKMKKVLVVDDAMFMRQTIRAILEKNGIEVIEADCVEEALEQYERHQPQVVTMDIAMPGKSGIEGVAELRRLDPGAQVIVITSIGTEYIIRDAITNGAVNFIVKPFDETKLMEVLHSLDV